MRIINNREKRALIMNMLIIFVNELRILTVNNSRWKSCFDLYMKLIFVSFPVKMKYSNIIYAI